MNQSEFNKFLAAAINTAPTISAGELTTRTNPLIAVFSQSAGAGLQLKKISMSALLAAVITSDLDYKIFEADITQSSTSAPVVTEVNDGLSTVLTPARTSAGLYTLTAATAVFVAGTTVEIEQNVPGSMFTAIVTSTSVITITSRTEDGTSKLLTATDALLAATRLTIKVPVS